MNKEKKYPDEIPSEIQEAVQSVDLHTVCSDIGAKLSLTPGQLSGLKNSLSSFLENIWYRKDFQLNIGTIKTFTESEQQILNREVYERVFLTIIHTLDKLGLNDSNALFETGDVKLTACKLYKGKYISYETDRLIHKNTELKRYGFFTRKDHHIIHLEADYPDKGRWGSVENICFRVDTKEKADAFLNQLKKAVIVGNFNYFLDIFSRFEIQKYTTNPV